MFRQATVASQREGYEVTIPGNYNSNFHQHRREFTQVTAGRKKAETGTIPVASDGAKYGAFRRNEMNKRH